MSPTNPTSSSDEVHQQLLDRLDIARLPRAFRSPNWKSGQRRNKNVKQILMEASRKESSVLATPQNHSGVSTPHPADVDGLPKSSNLPSEGISSSSHATIAQNISTLVLERNLKQNNSVTTGPTATYTNIDSPPSLHPAHQKHYCDITGLPAPYTDPKTRLRYHDQEVFAVVRSLGPGVAENYLEARGAQVVLR